MPRRYLDYPDAFRGWNLVSSYGSYLSALSFLYFMYIVYLTLATGPECAPNPWREKKRIPNENNDALYETKQNPIAGLEWSLPSPPAFHTFGDSLPVIRTLPYSFQKLYIFSLKKKKKRKSSEVCFEKISSMILCFFF